MPPTTLNSEEPVFDRLVSSPRVFNGSSELSVGDRVLVGGCG